jgi:teichuronic acid biosynthesis protein TuaE
LFEKVKVEVRPIESYKVPLNILKWLWLATLAAAFFGPLLAFSAWPNFFAYKILFTLHLLLFSILIAAKKVKVSLSPGVERYYVFFVLWFGWAVLSLLWCDNRMDGLSNIYYLFTGLCLIGFTPVYLNENDLKIPLFILIAVYSVVLAVGLWEVKTGQHLITAGFVFNSKVPRGIFKNPNDLATYLVLYLPLLYVTARYCLRRVITAPLAVILVVLMGTGAFLVVNTGSRANMLSLALAAAAAAVIYLAQGRLKALRNMLVVISMLIAIYIGTAAVNPKINYWSSRQYRIAKHHLVSLEYVGGESSARMILFKNSLYELNRHSLMGVGAGNAEEHMKKYRSDNFILLALHNWWLEILINYGFFILILYLAFYFKLLSDLFMVAVRAAPGLVKVLAESSFIALVAFPIAAVSSSSLMYARFMWILFGIALCSVHLYYEKNSEKEVGGS